MVSQFSDDFPSSFLGLIPKPVFPPLPRAGFLFFVHIQRIDRESLGFFFWLHVFDRLFSPFKPIFAQIGGCANTFFTALTLFLPNSKI